MCNNCTNICEWHAFKLNLKTRKIQKYEKKLVYHFEEKKKYI